MNIENDDNDKLEVIELDTDVSDVADKPKEPEEEKPLPEEPDDDEINSYSARVQARIKKMSAKTHAERRGREQAEQQLSEAIRAIQATHAENQRLRNEVSQRETFLKSSDKARIEASLAQARSNYKTAFDAGDADVIAATTAEIARLSSQLDRNESWQPAPPPPPPPEPRQQPRPPPQVDAKTLDWQDRNNWFGRDDAMTGFALGVHRHLVNVEGVDPRSDDYFSRIDSEMQKRFPEKFQKTAPAQRPSPVAPGGRAAGQLPPRGNRVELTRTQVQIAKKLGLTPEQYASELLKING